MKGRPGGIEVATLGPEPLVDPTANRIVTAGEEVGVVGVEALDPDPSPANASGGRRPIVVSGEPGRSLGGVGGVSGRERGRVDLGLGPIDGAGRFEPTDGSIEGAVDQPVPGWHRPAAVEQRLVSQHHRHAVGPTNRHLVTALGSASEQFGHHRPIVDIVVAGPGIVVAGPDVVVAGPGIAAGEIEVRGNRAIRAGDGSAAPFPNDIVQRTIQ